MRFFDQLADAVADLIRDDGSATPNGGFGGTFGRTSDPKNDPDLAAQRAASAAERFDRERRRRRRHVEDAARDEVQRRQEHDHSPLGRASAAAWHAYLGTPQAIAGYASLGFIVIAPPPPGERFVRDDPPRRFWQERVRVVVSIDQGDRVAARYSEPAWGDGQTWLSWTRGDDDGAVWARIAERIERGDGRTVALRLESSGNHTLTDTELRTLSRFVNGYDGDWLDGLAPGQAALLIAFRPGGQAAYDEMRSLFRASWEARQAR